MSLHDATIPVFVRGLTNLSALIDKGAAWLAETGTPETAITEARIIGDMLPFTKQVQLACDAAKFFAVRLGGVENVAMADEETTLAELKERIARTIAFVQQATSAMIDGKEAATVELKFPQGAMTFSGRDYAFGFALPNFFFHVTMAYALLRKEGVGIGKMDYLGGL